MYLVDPGVAVQVALLVGFLGVSLEDLGIEWVTELRGLTDYVGTITNFARQVEEAGGPVRWVRKRLVEFTLGFIVGIVGKISGVIASVWTFLADIVGSGTLEAWDGVAYLGDQGLGLIIWILDGIATATSWAGPLAPLVWLILASIVIFAVYRLTKALLTLINLDSLTTLING